MKNEFRTLSMKILTNGKVEGHEVESLRELISADGKIDREEAEFLIYIYKRTDQIAPAFEKFFYKVIKEHLLADGTIDSERAAWLRSLILVDGKVTEREKKLLREVRGEAKEISVEGNALIEECLTWPGSPKE
jgi:uncharacterized tellurite resistance protein B-like protein